MSDSKAPTTAVTTSTSSTTGSVNPDQVRAKMGWSVYDVNFPYVLEDPRIELQALNIWRRENPAKQDQTKAKRIRVMTIASGGDTALAIGALPDVSLVQAIDMNHGQIHCCRVKQAAVKLLPGAEIMHLMANPDDTKSGSDKTSRNLREKIFDSLAKHLPEDTIAFWKDSDRRNQLLSLGMHSFGFRQRDVAVVAEKLRSVSLHPYENGVEYVVKDENKERWDEVWMSNLLANVPTKPGVRFGTLVWNALRSGDQNNWFVRSFLNLRPVIEDLPLYLQFLPLYPAQNDPVVFEIKEMSQCLEEFRRNNQSFDFINVSNVLDGLTPEIRDKILCATRDALSIGGMALFRTGPMDVYNMPDIRKLVSNYLTVDTNVSDTMKKNERALMYFDTVVARRLK